MDDEQERLRREIAYLGIHYAYKPEEPAGFYDPNRIRIEEAAQALVILEPDPRYVVWLRREAGRFLDIDSEQYKSLFAPSLTAYCVVNAVRVNRYIQERMNVEAESATGLEKFAYKKGNYAVAWVLAKQLTDMINSARLLDEETLRRVVSVPYDDLRQTYWNQFQISANRGQRSLFINQTNSIPFLRELMITHYGLGTDLALQYKLRQSEADQPYPKALFDYLVSKAPQISQS